MMINFFHYLLIGEMLLIIIFMIYEVIKEATRFI